MASASASASTTARTIDFFRLPDARCTECEGTFPAPRTYALANLTKGQAKQLNSQLKDPLSYRTSSLLSKDSRQSIETHFPRINDDVNYLTSLRFKVGTKSANSDENPSNQNATDKTAYYVRVHEQILAMSCNCVTRDQGVTRPLFYHVLCLRNIEKKEGSVTCRTCHKLATWQLLQKDEEAATREEAVLTIQEARIPQAEGVISHDVPSSSKNLVAFPCECSSTQAERRYCYKNFDTVEATAELVARQLNLEAKNLTKENLSSELTHRKFSCVTCRQSFVLSKPLREKLEVIIAENLKGRESATSSTSNSSYTTAWGPDEHDISRSLRLGNAEVGAFKHAAASARRSSFFVIAEYERQRFSEEDIEVMIRTDPLSQQANQEDEDLNASVCTLAGQEQEGEQIALEDLLQQDAIQKQELTTGILNEQLQLEKELAEAFNGFEGVTDKPVATGADSEDDFPLLICPDSNGDFTFEELSSGEED